MGSMPEQRRRNGRVACPYLPKVERVLDAEWVRRQGGRRDAVSYRAALEYGQSLWLEGKPAQAILQLNKAWAAELQEGDAVLERWPLPYRALVWILVNAQDDCFLGNPVRHFQHLATRIRGQCVELRSWRAWACFHLSATVLSDEEFPPDRLQIETERLILPDDQEVSESLRQYGLAGEAELFELIMDELKNA